MDRAAGFVRPVQNQVIPVKNWFLISYDVHDEKRLKQVARLLEGRGERLQFSVFRCFLNKRELQRLRWELSRIMDPSDDLLVVRLCPGCVANIRNTHDRSQWPEDPDRVSVV